MTELGLLRLEIFLVMRVRFATNRNLLDHLQAVAFETDDFFRIVGEEAKLPHTKIEQNLRAESIITQIGRQTELRVRFDGIESLFLQLVGVNFRGEPNAATFLAHINEHAVAFFGNLPKRRM